MRMQYCFQVWQWLRHQTTLEESGDTITLEMVKSLVADVVADSACADDRSQQGVDSSERQTLDFASKIFLDIVSKIEFIDFVTTYLTPIITNTSC